MTDHSAAAVAGITPAPGARLEPDAIGAAVRGDPFVLHGVVRNWTIREWNEALVPGDR